ncbi:Uncharacterised protein [Legionella lansingensis]|nr:Uncharacterised protein [Legionella lansingensis]
MVQDPHQLVLLNQSTINEHNLQFLLNIFLIKNDYYMHKHNL